MMTREEKLKELRAALALIAAGLTLMGLALFLGGCA